jgi:DNA-binding HxlR family transcriptional regulator
MKKAKEIGKDRPIVPLLDRLGKRWSLRIIWELQAGPMKFRALRKACDGVSPSVLNKRIAELRELDFVKKSDGGYMLSSDGASLAEQLRKLDRWAHRREKQSKDK